MRGEKELEEEEGGCYVRQATFGGGVECKCGYGCVGGGGGGVKG